MPITLISVLKNITTAVSNNTNHLWRYLLKTPALRWSSSFLFVVATYASIMWLALSWTPTAVLTDTKPSATQEPEPVVYVRITINRDGTLVDYRLTQPSAHKPWIRLIQH
jgi:hypothetical protein